MQSLEEIQTLIALHDKRLTNAKVVSVVSLPGTVVARTAQNEIEHLTRALDDLHTKRRRIERLP